MALMWYGKSLYTLGRALCQHAAHKLGTKTNKPETNKDKAMYTSGTKKKTRGKKRTIV